MGLGEGLGTGGTYVAYAWHPHGDEVAKMDGVADGADGITMWHEVAATGDRQANMARRGVGMAPALVVAH